MTDTLGRLLRFGMVGFSGVLIDFSITWLCKEKLKLNKFTANAAGFTLAVTSNYILNRVWTFKNTSPDIFKQFTWFLLIGIIGLAINTGILYLFHEKRKFHFYLSKAAAIAFVFCWNFAANSLLTFRYK